jgi:hypothetical protein
MKTYGRMEVQLHAFLTLALDGGMWLVSHPGCFTPGERAAGIDWTGSQMGSTAGLEVVAKNLPLPGIEPRSSSL